MEGIALPIYNTAGKEVESIKLNSAVFDGEINEAAIHQAVLAYRASHRKGLAATKTRGEVSGGGKKPWRQKGTGRARVGSIRSPLWRHGGVIFGPHPRDFSYRLPQKIKNLALRSCLNAKIKDKNLIILDDLKLQNPKTKGMIKVLAGLKVTSGKKKKPLNTLLLTKKMDDNLELAGRNINFLNVNLAKDTHAYEVLSHQKLIITRDGLNDLTQRLKK